MLYINRYAGAHNVLQALTSTSYTSTLHPPTLQRNPFHPKCQTYELLSKSMAPFKVSASETSSKDVLISMVSRAGLGILLAEESKVRPKAPTKKYRNSSSASIKVLLGLM